MVSSAPPVDPRTAVDIARQLRQLLAIYAPGWHEQSDDTRTGLISSDPLGRALIAVFSRFAETILQRLNQVPDKNLLAFLDLLGEAHLPPQAARVPLTFSLAPGSIADALVPIGTQVAAPPAEGEQEPVLFETERELVVSAAQLAFLLIRDPGADRYADHSSWLTAPAATAIPVFTGNQALEHVLYLGDDVLFARSDLQQLRLTFRLANELADADPRTLQWEIWDGKDGLTLTPADDTGALTRNGEVTLTAGLSAFPIPEQRVAETSSRWLRCRLLTPITLDSVGQGGRVRVAHLPEIDSLTATITCGQVGLSAEVAFANQLALDLGKDFFPFGEKPRFGDTFYLAHALALADAGSRVTVHVELSNPEDDDQSPIAPTRASEKLDLAWEYWDGQAWIAPHSFVDDTAQLARSGTVSFILATPPRLATVNGLVKYWLRVRLIAGDYGQEARYEAVDPEHAEKGYRFIPASFAPPAIRRLRIDYALTRQELALDTIVAHNDFAYLPCSAAFKPFQASSEARPTLYLGFTLPTGPRVFPNRQLSLYLRAAEVKYGAALAGLPSGQASPSGTPPGTPLRIAWTYWNGAHWADLKVQDGSDNFTRSGLLEWLVPGDFASRSEFARQAYWLRARWESGDYPLAAHLSRVLFNTTPAVQAVSVREEIVGSSDGSEKQRFRSVHAPVLAGQRLEVRERELPAAAEQTLIQQAGGEDAITVIDDASGRPREIWVRWLPVPDFYASGPRDRHYVLDALSGEIGFGDGRHGLIPSVGAGNVRLAHYRTGGGARGNRPAASIVQLKTTVPYVDKVSNREPAEGGADAEALASLLQRAPRALRHRHRAVSVEDYQDLALLASPEVARARCVPLHDLASDPDALVFRPGTVSLIVVPHSSDARPLPSLALIDQVRRYLDQRRLPTADLVVVGPEYVRVDVVAGIALLSMQGASIVESAVAQALARFLHPLSGGLDRNGWDFGRKPHPSDLYALLEAVPGVDHLHSLQITEREERPGALASGRFLVHSGSHDIRLSFTEP
ncbi:MAG: putative baseplate assembly protein [Candidatus Accumulibacter meliphilus]|jgi:predicted phage baseplate assembly protein|uniref:Putative baseplate assembly protein n=1 Tax=Candidatus Accumulibacter meliphilus TaxID=2211374 RepID=A0A369XQ91_9PROT|nr:MAG: putative baseplate assembly protein [Candidatus Accumulibacter meliphilus]